MHWAMNHAVILARWRQCVHKSNSGSHTRECLRRHFDRFSRSAGLAPVPTDAHEQTEQTDHETCTAGNNRPHLHCMRCMQCGLIIRRNWLLKWTELTPFLLPHNTRHDHKQRMAVGKGQSQETMIMCWDYVKIDVSGKYTTKLITKNSYSYAQ